KEERQAVLTGFLTFVNYFGAPCFVIAATSATRLPRSRAAASSLSSMPGDSGPVVALAPKLLRHPQRSFGLGASPRGWLTSQLLSIRDRTSGRKSAADLIPHLEVAEDAKLEEPVVKEGLHLARHVSEIHRRSDDDRVGE